MNRELEHRHVDVDRWIDLSHGLVAADEREALLAAARSCAACEAAFRDAVGDRERFASWQAGGTAERGAAARTTRPWLGAAAVAATVLLGALIGLTVGPRPPEPPVAAAGKVEIFRYPSGERLVLRSDGSSARLFERGVDAYERGDDEEVIRLLGGTTPVEPPLVPYLAGALAGRGRLAEADRLLTDAPLATFPQPSRRRAQWLHYSVLRALGDASRAVTLLGEIDPGSGDLRVAIVQERQRVGLEGSGIPNTTKPPQ